MSSLINDEYIKYRLNNMSYPDYSNPFLNLANSNLANSNMVVSSWNLNIIKDDLSCERKKKLKLMEQIINDDDDTLNYTKRINHISQEVNKNDIIQWLKSLTNEQKYEIFCIEDEWLCIVLIKMYQKNQNKKDNVFALLFEDNKNAKESKNIFDFGELENHFYCRKQQSCELYGSSTDQSQRLKQAEQELIENIRIYDHKDFYDTLVFSSNFIENIDRAIEIFNIISDNHAFSQPYRKHLNHHLHSHMKSHEILDTPWWFNPNTFQTLSSWIISSFEKVIWIKYFEQKHQETIELVNQLEFKITLSYKNSIIEYWKNLEKSKKRRVLNGIQDFIFFMKNYKTQEFDTKSAFKQDKFRNNKEKLAYLYAIYQTNDLLNNSNDQILSISEFFYNMLDEGCDEKLIDSLLFTTLDEFGSIGNFVARKFVIKLKNMYAETIASELILADQIQKSTKPKQVKSKRKSLKRNKTDDITLSNEVNHIENSSKNRQTENPLFEGLISDPNPFPNQVNSKQNPAQESNSTQINLQHDEINFKNLEQKPGLNLPDKTDNVGDKPHHDGDKICDTSGKECDGASDANDMACNTSDKPNNSGDKAYNTSDKAKYEIENYCRALIANLIINKSLELIESHDENNHNTIGLFASQQSDTQNCQGKSLEHYEERESQVKSEFISISRIQNKEKTSKSTIEKKRNKKKKFKNQSSSEESYTSNRTTILLTDHHQGHNHNLVKDLETSSTERNRPDESETTQDTRSPYSKSINDIMENNNLNIDDLSIFDEFDKKISRSKKRRMRRKLKIKGIDNIKEDNTCIINGDYSDKKGEFETENVIISDINNENTHSNKAEKALSHSNSQKILAMAQDNNPKLEESHESEHNSKSNLSEIGNKTEETLELDMTKSNIKSYENCSNQQISLLASVNMLEQEIKEDFIEVKSKRANKLIETDTIQTKQIDLDQTNNSKGIFNLQHQKSNRSQDESKEFQKISQESKIHKNSNKLKKTRDMNNQQYVSKPHKFSNKSKFHIENNPIEAKIISETKILTNHEYKNTSINQKTPLNEKSSSIDLHAVQSHHQQQQQQQEEHEKTTQIPITQVNTTITTIINTTTKLNKPKQQQHSSLSKSNGYKLVKKKPLFDMAKSKIQVNRSIIQHNIIHSNQNQSRSNKPCSISKSSYSESNKSDNVNSPKNKNIESLKTNPSSSQLINNNNQANYHNDICCDILERNQQKDQEKQGSANLENISPIKISNNAQCNPKTNDEELADKFFKKKLENDIISYVEKLTNESNKVMDYRITAFKRIEYVISHCFPNSNVTTKLFGSCATGLALKNSDIDVAISGLYVIDSSNIINILYIIQEKIRLFKWIISSKPIYTASVPVLKLEINPKILFEELHVPVENRDYILNNMLNDPNEISKLNLNTDNLNNIEQDIIFRVDLSVELYPYMNSYNTHHHLGYLTTDYIQEMLNLFPSLYAITIILKQYLQNRNLLNMYIGGISSYCLTLLIIAYYKKYGEINYSNDFLNILNFYGNQFDSDTIGINLSKDKEPFFSLNNEDNYHHPHNALLMKQALTLYDNINIGKNLGSGSYNIKYIFNEFKKSIQKLQEFKTNIENIIKEILTEIETVDNVQSLNNHPLMESVNKINLLELILF